MMLWLSIALLSFVTLQRLAELVYARRNTATLLARGAREYAPESSVSGRKSSAMSHRSRELSIAAR